MKTNINESIIDKIKQGLIDTDIWVCESAEMKPDTDTLEKMMCIWSGEIETSDSNVCYAACFEFAKGMYVYGLRYEGVEDLVFSPFDWEVSCKHDSDEEYIAAIKDIDSWICNRYCDSQRIVKAFDDNLPRIAF